ncbi:MAG: hypothetical protein ACP5NU_01225 [Methanomicrobiales archaeon]
MPTPRPISTTILLTLLSASLLLAGCSSQTPPPAEQGQLTLTLTSDAFPANRTIPVRHTCDGEG